jgi:thioesterase domain-containing protein
VAFEMARQLAGAGQAPDAVVLIDSYHLPPFEPEPVSEAELRTRAAGSAGLSEGSPLASAIASEMMHNGRLASAYMPAPYDNPVVLIKADTPAHWAGHQAASSNGWNGLAHRLRIDRVSGSHWDLFAPERIAATAAAIVRAIGAPHES